MSGARSLHQWVRDTFALRPTDPIDALSRGMSRREYLLRPANPLFIQTVRGIGYVFIPEGQPR